MKIAISIPDDVLAEAEKLVAELGTSRSKLYARALGRFVGEHAPDRVAAEINAAEGDHAAIVRAAARQVIARTEW